MRRLRLHLAGQGAHHQGAGRHAWTLLAPALLGLDGLHALLSRGDYFLLGAWQAALKTTGFLFQVHFWEVLLDICVVVLVGKLLEPLWGAVEMVVFFMVVNVGVAMLSAFFYYLLYMVTFNTHLLFDVHIHGESLLQA